MPRRLTVAPHPDPDGPRRRARASPVADRARWRAVRLPAIAARSDLSKLVTSYPLAEANAAMADMAAGRVLKPVLTMG